MHQHFRFIRHLLYEVSERQWILFVALESDVRQTLIAIVEILAVTITRTLDKLTELDLLAILALITIRAGAYVVVPRIPTIGIVLAGVLATQIIRYFTFQYRCAIDSDHTERGWQEQIIFIQWIQFNDHRMRAIAYFYILYDALEVVFLIDFIIHDIFFGRYCRRFCTGGCWRLCLFANWWSAEI